MWWQTAVRQAVAVMRWCLVTGRPLLPPEPEPPRAPVPVVDQDGQVRLIS